MHYCENAKDDLESSVLATIDEHPDELLADIKVLAVAMTAKYNRVVDRVLDALAGTIPPEQRTVALAVASVTRHFGVWNRLLVPGFLDDFDRIHIFNRIVSYPYTCVGGGIIEACRSLRQVSDVFWPKSSGATSWQNMMMD